MRPQIETHLEWNWDKFYKCIPMLSKPVYVKPDQPWWIWSSRHVTGITQPITFLLYFFILVENIDDFFKNEN